MATGIILKYELGMILVVIWYEYHTSIFAVYDGMHACIYSLDRNMTVIQLAGLAVYTRLSNSFDDPRHFNQTFSYQPPYL